MIRSPARVEDVIYTYMSHAIVKWLEHWTLNQENCLFWAMLFNPHCLSPLRCINEHLAADRSEQI